MRKGNQKKATMKKLISAKTSHLSYSKTTNHAGKSWLIASLFLVIVPAVESTAIAESPDWFQTIASSCEAGVTQDCLNAAVALKKGDLHGKKITKDPGKSQYYTNKAVRSGEKNCKQGDTLDCYTIGLLYFEGGGIIATDIPRGLDYLQKSCKSGYKKACDWLDNSGLR